MSDSNKSLAQTTPGGARKRGGKFWPLLVLLAVGATALGVMLAVAPGVDGQRDAALCPPDGGSHRAVFLVDVRKPLDADLAELPGRLLESVTLDLQADTQLLVYALGEQARTPRRLIGRICKPYSNADLQVAAAKDQKAAVRDCDDLPSQIPAQLREDARAFCQRRTALRERIGLIPTPDIGSPVPRTYLVEALEETMHASASRPAPDAVYVFSDMMQHADWFSHVNADPADWRIEALRAADRGRGRPARPPSAGMRVTVFYLPRTGLTDEPGMELLHKRFWRAYFGAAPVSFRNQPASLGYVAGPPPEPQPEVPGEERAGNEEPAPEPGPEETAQVERFEEIAAREAEIAEGERRLAAERQQHEQRLAEIVARERAVEERLAVVERDSDSDAAPPGSEDGAATRAIAATSGTVPDSPGPSAEPAADAAEPPAGTAQPVPNTVDAPASPAAPPVVAAAQPEQDPEPAEPGPVPRTPAEPEAQVCAVAHKAGNAMPEYPGSRNIGGATIVVSFDIDAVGGTVDDSVAVVASRSQADRPPRMDRFGRAAVAVVRDWEFESETTAECEMAQSTTITIEFRYPP